MGEKNFTKPKRIAFLTSGGDAPGMNACIRSLVRTALHNAIEPVGVKRGFQGLLSRDFIPFNGRSVANILQRGGTVLMSSRCEEFLLSEQRAAAYLNLRRANIDALIAIGGDGTMRGLDLFSREHRMAVYGIPGTIDNDLLGTDYTLGFDTALNTALEMVDRLRDTTASYDRVMLVEVMGRHCGQIALHVGLASGAEEVLLPETKTDLDQLVSVIKTSHQMGKNSHIIIVAEGEELGGSVEIAKKLEGKLEIPVRICILGHVQRGGRPTARDRILAAKLGSGAVTALIEGKHSMMVGEINHKIAHTPFLACVEKPKPLPKEDIELLAILAK